jgi:hypothetical protein
MRGVTRNARELPGEWAEMMAHDLAEDALEIADELSWRAHAAGGGCVSWP